MATFSLKRTEILNSVDRKVQQQENRLRLTYDNVTRQVVKAKTEIEIHCATELATLELTCKENVEHLDATVGKSIDSKRHKALINKKLTVAISELLNNDGKLESTQSTDIDNDESPIPVTQLFTAAMKEFLTTNDLL